MARSGPELLHAGIELYRRGQTDAAYHTFAQAIMSGHHDAAPAGLWWSGSCLQDLGDTKGAADFFRRVIDTGHPNWATRAELALATMLDDHGDVAEAREHYQRVIDFQRTEHDELHARVAAARLEVMLTQHGEIDRARAVYDRATGHGQIEEQVRFAFNRADAWKRRGNLAAAAGSLREIAAGDSPRAPEAAYMLGQLLWEQGDLEGAYAAFQIAVDSSDPLVAPQAASMQKRCI
jgi:tetratricopeptide (TPR) repeat protein